jgi:two-component system, cell cycle response regulator DivK
MLGTESVQARPQRILIVEDNDLNLTLIKELLEHRGYEIVVAGLGEAAMGLAIEHPPDLILLDIQLPDIPGTEVARRLKADERTRTIPIIAVTAFAMSGDRDRIITSGCDEYVSKPIQLSEFFELVAGMLPIPRLDWPEIV